MAQANINIRTDADLKQDFERLCRDVGMNLSTAINVFMKQSVNKNRIPLSLDGDPFYSESNMTYLRECIRRADGQELTEHELIDEDKP